MYFGTGSINWLFAKSTWYTIGVAFILAIWKIIDIIVWLLGNIKVTWG